jgi:hypothetical protein
VNGNDIVLSQEQFQNFIQNMILLKVNHGTAEALLNGLIKRGWKTYGKDLLNFDGKITTFYTNNAEFISNNHKVIFSSAKSGNNRFEIKSHHIILTRKPPLKISKSYFPN